MSTKFTLNDFRTNISSCLSIFFGESYLFGLAVILLSAISKYLLIDVMNTQVDNIKCGNQTIL